MSSSISSIGLGGMREAERKISEIAQRITAPSPDSDFVADIVALKTEEHSFRASQAVVKVGQRLEDSVLDILA